MVKELDEKYGVVYDKENIETFQTTELRYIHKVMNKRLIYNIRL
jgi:aminopeptidase C